MFADSSPRLVAVVVVLFVAATISFGLRCYVRLSKTKWGIDDWFMAAAVLPFTMLTIACFIGASNGIGVQDIHLTAERSVIALQWFFLAQVFYCVSIMFIKISIALQLARIASGKKPYRITLWIVVGIISLSLTFTTIYLLLMCAPIKANWIPTTPGAKCLPSIGVTAVSFTQSGINIATDWICAILPIPLLWDVKMNRSSKISVLALLGLGIFASASAMIRLKYTVSYMNPSANYLYGVNNLVIWAYAEAGIGMTVGCAGCLRPLFSNILKSGSSFGYGSKDSYVLQSRKNWTGVKVPGAGSRARSNSDKLPIVTNVMNERRGSSGSSMPEDEESSGIHVKYEVDRSVC